MPQGGLRRYFFGVVEGYLPSNIATAWAYSRDRSMPTSVSGREADRRQQARAAAVSEKRLLSVALANDPKDGDPRAAEGKAGPVPKSRALRRGLRLTDGHGRSDSLGM
jgi:hypothetical protein